MGAGCLKDGAAGEELAETVACGLRRGVVTFEPSQGGSPVMIVLMM
jgi:hypothetical protein